MSIPSLFGYFLGLACLLALGCGQARQASLLATAMPDEWLVKGRLSNESFRQGEVIALAMDGRRHRTLIKDNMSFGVNVPGNATYALYFIKPSSTSFSLNSNDKSQPNYAVLSFENGSLGESETLRLPEPSFDETLDLGIIDIKGSHAYPAVSPPTLLDFDSDGILDVADIDDQNDNLNDLEQKKKLEEMTICYQKPGQNAQQKVVHLSKLLPHLEQGATIGPCPKRVP